MEWRICFAISAACLLLSIVLAIIRGRMKYKVGRIIDPFNILFVGIILSSVILFVPIYANTFSETGYGIWETVFLSVYNMFGLFIISGDFSFITSNISGLSEGLSRAYSVLFSVLFVLAPIMTFGFVLSFLKSISAYKRYITHFNSDIYIFSELNDRSVALAKDLYESDPKGRFIVFTDVFQKEDKNSELIEKARVLGAVCFKKDITTINFAFHGKKSELNFFAISEDRSENIGHALDLIGNFKYRKNTNLYVFSTGIESEILLSNAVAGACGDEQSRSFKIKVRRVNEIQSLINRNLYDCGYEKIFASAYQAESGIKKISAVVVGMGQHGTEMTKALAWFCQMDGYEAEINCFDADKKADEKFMSLCPELMDPDLNGKFGIDGEAKYKISVHSEIDVDTKTFDDMIRDLPRVTYVFVALGNDEKNISVAVKLRSIFLRAGFMPEIQAVVYNTEKKKTLAGITNFKNQEYKIDFIGDIQSSYSEAVILSSDLEAEALKRHMRWGNEKAFWQYDYNYKSSVASAIHRKMKILCGMSGVEKLPEERSDEELWALRKLEHCRWNAYMRSEGYVYGGTVEKSGRNDLAKMHNCLVPFDMLPLNEQKKDDD